MSVLLSTISLLFFVVGSTQAYHDLYHVPNTSVNNSEHRGMPVIEYSFDKEFAQEYIKYFDFENPTAYTFKDLSDAAVYLTRLGQVDEALDLLEWLHLHHPEEYQIINNLGTTYDLAGNIDSAEHYINKAITLQPEAHQGSKWVHLKILAAKRKMQVNSEWILNNKVLNFNWDTTFYADYPDSVYVNSQQDSIRKWRYKVYENQFDSLFHVGLQIGAHIPFSVKPDLLIANIMKELGDYFGLHLSVKNAFIAYKIGIHYDPKDQLKIKDQLALLMPSFRKYEFDEHVFEAKFRPFLALELEEKKKLLLHNSNSNADEVQKASKALYWQAGLALVLILGLLIRITIAHQNDKKQL